jgi:hypothetical protein
VLEPASDDSALACAWQLGVYWARSALWAPLLLLQPPRIMLSAVQVWHEQICRDQAAGALPLPTDVMNLDIAGFRKLLKAISGHHAPFQLTISARRGK